MMKKLILLTIAGTISLGMYAQENNGSILRVGNAPLKRVAPGSTIGRPSGNSANKGTATGGSRWYSTFQLVNDNYTAGALESNRFVGTMGWDKKFTQTFSSGQDTVNWCAVANFIDPIYSDGFNSTSYYDPLEIRVREDNSYTIDSIYFPAAYVEKSLGADTIIDTLYLSVAGVPYEDNVYTSANPRYKDVDEYEGVTENKGEMRLQKLSSVNADHQLNYPNKVQWKFPLSDTLRKPENRTDNTVSVQNYLLEVPGKCSVSAKQGIGISYSLKPGQEWAMGDSIESRHRMLFMVGYTGRDQRMPYFYYNYHDHSQSYLMFATAPNNYAPATAIEVTNPNIDYTFEFIWIDARITCTNCWDLGITKDNSTIGNFSAYPNPAINDINISYSLNKAADVNIAITNTMGQVIKSHHVANATAGIVPFSLTELSNGVYFYTVKADGETVTRRFVVSH